MKENKNMQKIKSNKKSKSKAKLKLKDNLNQKFRDTVFGKLCEEPRNLVRIFQELCPSEQKINPNGIEHFETSAILTNGLYNDVSFLYQNRLYIFIEAQSTWNYNMAFRLGEYVFQALGAYVERNKLNRYANSPMNLPTPVLFVVYSGNKKNVPEFISLREQNFQLSSDFTKFSEFPFSVEVRAKVVYNKTVENQRDSLIFQYIKFTNIAERIIKKKPNGESYPKRIFKVAIRLHILESFLREHEVEIMNIMNRDLEQRNYWDMEKIRQFDKGKEEGRIEGKIEGKKEGILEEKKESILSMLSMDMPYQVIAQISRSTVEFVKEVANSKNSGEPSISL